MALRDKPYLPLYVQDFLTDEKLNECSAESTGVYIRLMCVMHKSEEYGVILLKQKWKQNESKFLNFAFQLAKQMPYDTSIIERGLRELSEEGVITVDDDAISQKRMVKDGNLSNTRAYVGKKGGRPKTGDSVLLMQNQKQNESKTESKTKANCDIDIDIENEDHKEEKKDKEVEGSGGKGKKETKPCKVQFAEFVSMTNAEYSALVAKHGEHGAARCVEILDNYKGSKGKKYVSDYRAILSWVEKSYEEEKAGGRYRARASPSGIPALEMLKGGFFDDENGDGADSVASHAGLPDTP